MGGLLTADAPSKHFYWGGHISLTKLIQVFLVRWTHSEWLDWVHFCEIAEATLKNKNKNKKQAWVEASAGFKGSWC